MKTPKSNQTVCTLKNGLISIQASGKKLFAMKGLSGSITLDGTEFKLKDAKRVVSKAGREEFLFANGIRWIRSLRKDGGSTLLENSIVNESKNTFRISSWDVLIGEKANGFTLETGNSPKDLRCFCWIPWNMEVADLAQKNKQYWSTTILHLSDARDGFTLMLAFVTIDRMYAAFSLQSGKGTEGIASFYGSLDCGGFKLKPGKTLDAEQIRVSAFDDPYEALNTWADEEYERYQPDFRGTAGVMVTGGVWRDPFTSKTGARYTLDERIRLVEEKFAGFGLNLSSGGSHGIYKDGLPGNWMTFEKCPQGDYGDLQGKTHRKTGWNFKSWFSPFWFFGEAEQTLKENRENLLKRGDGTPICHEFQNGWEFGRKKYNKDTLHMYYLDGTHPKTKEYLKKVFKFYRDKMGVRGYMLDFLYSVPGAKLYDESLLPAQISRSVFKTIREVCTWDTHLQTAVASSPAYIGCVNSARVVRDFGEGRPQHPYPNWQNSCYCMHDLHFSNIHSFIQNAAASWFTNRKIYVNDLNELTIDNPVPLEFARMAITMFGLSGDSPVAAGDDLAVIAPDRLRMFKMILPRTKGIPVPVDLFERTTENGGCHILKKSIETAYDKYMLAAVFNEDPTAAMMPALVNMYGGQTKVKQQKAKDFETRIDFAKLGLDPKKKYCVYEFWNNEYYGVYRKSFLCKVPVGTCKLFRITEYRDYPWIISTDMHVEQGNAEILNAVFDEKKLTLKITAKRPVGESGRIILLMPRPYRVVNHERVNTMKEVIDMQTICSVPVEFDRETVTTTLQFERLNTPFVARIGWLPYATEKEWRKYVKEHPFDDPNRVI